MDSAIGTEAQNSGSHEILVLELLEPLLEVRLGKIDLETYLNLASLDITKACVTDLNHRVESNGNITSN